jgi:hypothetical protein
VALRPAFGEQRGGHGLAGALDTRAKFCGEVEFH